MWIQLSNYYGLLKVSGPDAQKFLQGQLTCDINSITATHHGWGAHCNPQGRVISFFKLFKFGNDIYLFMPRFMVPITVLALKKYAVFYQVEVTPADEIEILGAINIALDQLPACDTISVQTYSNEPNRHLIIGKTQDINSVLKSVNVCIHADVDKWKILDLAVGIPTIYPETSGKFLPHEINLPNLNAIDFNKGCYTGQEIIARMQYRGKLKKHLYQANIITSFPLTPGSDIYYGDDDQTGAILVDCCNITNNQYQTLIISEAMHAKDNHLFINQNNRVYFHNLNKV